MLKQAITSALLALTLTAGTMPTRHSHTHVKPKHWTASQKHERAELALSAIMFGECRGQSFKCMLMVGHVSMNRAKLDLDRRYGHGLWGVIHKHHAFSCLNKTDPNRRIILLAETNHLPAGADKAKWLEAKAIAHLLMHRFTIDPTHGATHYYAVSMPKPPRWIHDKGMTYLTTVDGHAFYRKA